MMNRVNFNLPSGEYYANTLLQPGLNFFMSLITNPRTRELKVNLPNSLFIKDKIYLARYDALQRKLIINTDFLPMDFYSSFKTANADAKFPAIMRTPTDLCGFRPEMLDWSKLYDKVVKSQLPASGVKEYIVNASERPRLGCC
jgi:hypothetical protein